MDFFSSRKQIKICHKSSLWFKENKTPWDNDLQCARVLHAALNKEVRCSNAAWQEGDEGAAWTKLIRGEEKDLDWDNA